jgi:tripartite-type tricarboxylate transporter receptor subunit TctC
MTKRLTAILTAATLALAAGIACAQPYPSKPIRWIVPYTPGGITDNVTRMVTARVSATLGQPIVIENKPGANSMIGVDLVAKSPADGYTIVTVIAAHAANATLYEGRIPYDPVKSLVPVSLAAIAPLIITASNSFAPNDMRSLIAYAKANPGKVNFGSSGIGAAAHLTTELLAQTAGVSMTHVPYKGTAGALTDLTAGNIQILVDVPSTLMPHVRGAKIKALGMFSAKRLPSAPEVPTLPESGGPALEASTWVMFLAPAGTPPEVVAKLSQAVSDAVKSPEITGKFNELGIIPVGNTSEQAATFLRDEVAKWGQVIRTAGVKAE